MKLLNSDIVALKFKDIKEEVANIDVSSSYKTAEFDSIVDLLLKDSRKNVNALGNKLLKEKNKILDEIKRVRAFNIIAGVDEVGRGPLAGPIVSCAVVLDLNVLDEQLLLWINDSKKLNEKKREELSEIIKEKALAYYIASCDSEEIDKRGIGVCNNAVFLEATNSLQIKPDLVLSDGYTIKGIDIPNK